VILRLLVTMVPVLNQPTIRCFYGLFKVVPEELWIWQKTLRRAQE